MNDMALNGSKQEIIAERRRRVARLRLRGLSQREIKKALNDDWSLGIINRDLAAIRSKWQSEAIADINEHIADQIAQLAEVRRVAWQNDDLGTVIKTIEADAKILGTNAPSRKEVSSGNEPVKIVVEYVNASDD